MHRNSYVNSLTEIQILAYVLKYISEGKNMDQITERFDGDDRLVKIWVKTLQEIHFITKNSFNELVMTSNGKDYLQKLIHTDESI
jgi:hypothetical protein